MPELTPYESFFYLIQDAPDFNINVLEDRIDIDIDIEDDYISFTLFNKNIKFLFNGIYIDQINLLDYNLGDVNYNPANYDWKEFYLQTINKEFENCQEFINYLKLKYK